MKTKKIDPNNLVISGFDRLMERALVARGVPMLDILECKGRLDLEESIIKIDQSIERIPVKIISPAKQMRALRSILKHPYDRKPYTLGISSYPTDQKAKQLAIHLMAIAIQAQQERPVKGRAMPMWHRVYGGFGDALRDKESTDLMPSMLFIANLTDMSQPNKVEKVRDLLEKFSHIPRVVISGGESPVGIFANKLRSPLTAGIYLGPEAYV